MSSSFPFSQNYTMHHVLWHDGIKSFVVAEHVLAGRIIDRHR